MARSSSLDALEPALGVLKASESRSNDATILNIFVPLRALSQRPASAPPAPGGGRGGGRLPCFAGGGLYLWEPLAVPIDAIYPTFARPSYYRPVEDTARIVRMVACKLLSKGMYPKGLLRPLRAPPLVATRAAGSPSAPG